MENLNFFLKVWPEYSVRSLSLTPEDMDETVKYLLMASSLILKDAILESRGFQLGI